MSAPKDPIDWELHQLEKLRLDYIVYTDSKVLLDHYTQTVVPAVREFVRQVQETGHETRLLDLEEIGYRVTLDANGDVTNVRIRGWGVDPSDYGP